VKAGTQPRKRGQNSRVISRLSPLSPRVPASRIRPLREFLSQKMGARSRTAFETIFSLKAYLRGGDTRGQRGQARNRYVSCFSYAGTVGQKAGTQPNKRGHYDY
jgi:hypothetical protein